MANDKDNNMSVIPAIIGAGASLIGGYINNQYAKRRSDEQWNRTLYMQDKMNAYNAPVAQMERLEQAGLNPNLVYGNGGAVIQSAGGNAPQPPQSAPIDTQGVLQMVQTIVGAMLEKDKIQASKDMQSEQIRSNQDIADARNATDVEVANLNNKSSERNVDVTTSSNESIASERNKTEKEINEERIKSNEQIEDAKIKENRRQFDLDFAHRVSVDNARISIDRSLANSTIALHSSQIELNNLSAELSKSIQPYLVDKAKYEAVSLAITTNSQKLNNYLSQPMELDMSVLRDLCKDAGLGNLTREQLAEIYLFHRDQVRLFNQEIRSQTSTAYYKDLYAEWMAFWGASSGPFKLGITAATIK